MAHNYLSYTLQIHDYLMELKRLLQPYDTSQEVSEWLDDIARMNEKLENMRFQVAVVGEFKRGKTSFINALLRKAILPADVVPATATINRITYGNVPSSYIYWKDGRPAEKIEIDQLADYITKLTDQSAMKASSIKEAVVQYPCRFCENNVDLIDTPGMNDDDDMNRVTIRQLSDIDLAIVTLDPNFPVSNTESRFIAQLVESDQICQIVFVVSKMDTVFKGQRERLLKTIEDRLRNSVGEILRASHEEGSAVMLKYRSLLSSPVLFPISSTQALYAYEMGDQQAFEESGFQRLTNELLPLIIRTQHSAAILTPLRTILRILHDFKEQMEEWRKMTALEAKRTALKKRFGEAAYESRLDRDRIWKDCADRLARCRRERSQAVYNTLLRASSRFSVREAIIAEMKTVFPQIRDELRQEEYDSYAWIWDEYFRPVGGTLKRVLTQIADEAGYGITGEIEGELSLLERQNPLPPHLCVPESFFWEASPVPPENMPGGQRPYLVDNAVRESFDTYYKRREKRLSEFLDNTIAEHEKAVGNLVRKFFQCATPRFQQEYQKVEEEERMILIARMDRLETGCYTTEKEYTTHINTD